MTTKYRKLYPGGSSSVRDGPICGLSASVVRTCWNLSRKRRAWPMPKRSTV